MWIWESWVSFRTRVENREKINCFTMYSTDYPKIILVGLCVIDSLCRESGWEFWFYGWAVAACRWWNVIGNVCEQITSWCDVVMECWVFIKISLKICSSKDAFRNIKKDALRIFLHKLKKKDRDTKNVRELDLTLNYFNFNPHNILRDENFPTDCAIFTRLRLNELHKCSPFQVILSHMIDSLQPFSPHFNWLVVSLHGSRRCFCVLFTSNPRDVK